MIQDVHTSNNRCPGATPLQNRYLPAYLSFFCEQLSVMARARSTSAPNGAAAVAGAVAGAPRVAGGGGGLWRDAPETFGGVVDPQSIGPFCIQCMAFVGNVVSCSSYREDVLQKVNRCPYLSADVYSIYGIYGVYDAPGVIFESRASLASQVLFMVCVLVCTVLSWYGYPYACRYDEKDRGCRRKIIFHATTRLFVSRSRRKTLL